MKARLLVIALGACLVPLQAVASVYSQAAQASGTAIVSSTLSDFPAYNSYSFDDFTVTGAAWQITNISLPGVVSATGSITSNFYYRITAAANFNTPGTIYASGTLAATTVATGTMAFNGLNVILTAGNYWLSAWADGSNANGYWNWTGATPGPYGAEAQFHNPGNGFAMGTAPVNMTTATAGAPAWRDQAFSITYNAVPEPASIVFLATGVLLLGANRKRRR